MTTIPDDGAPFLDVRGITKHFPGVRALHRVNLSVRPGEVLAVIGENGAGKSTLMKILAGVQTPDTGSIHINGQSVRIPSVEASLRHGIALIHQELNLADNLDVASNIFLGREPLRFGLIDRAAIRRESARFLDLVGLDVPPRRIISHIALGQQQLVEIAKALSVNARLLIMDEPTSSLSQCEAEVLFRVVRELRNRGVSIIYVSHRLGEVNELADRVVVLRDGENAGELNRDAINHDRMVRLMVGRDVSQFYQHWPHTPGDVVLEVERLRTPAHPAHELSFRLRAGEVVGLAGLVGAGRTELLQTLFGITPALSGRVRVQKKDLRIRSPIDTIRAGLALVPEDRAHQGLILDMAVRENLTLASLRREQRLGFTHRRREAELSADMLRKLRVKTPSARQLVRFLSGGNQQKVALGKWLALNPRVLFLDEPTRGIDVGAKEEIYKLMEELAQDGVAVLFVSSEMEEILGMSDRTLVMHEGRIAGELARNKLTEEAVLQLATGAT